MVRRRNESGSDDKTDLASFPRGLTLLSQSYRHYGQEHLIAEWLKSRLCIAKVLISSQSKPNNNIVGYLLENFVILVIVLDYWNPHKKFYLLRRVDTLNKTAN